MAKKILIIDDDVQILYAMSEICKYKNWVPITALDVVDGIELFKELSPDIVIIDYHLPIINGIDGVKNIRLLDKNIPIIILTVEEDQKIADAFKRAGATDFSLKPIKAPDIIARIELNLKLNKYKKYSDEINKKSEIVLGENIKGISTETLNMIIDYMEWTDNYLTIDEISERVGLSYQTTHRYLQHMIEKEVVEIYLIYGNVGRPKKKYKINKEKIQEYK